MTALMVIVEFLSVPLFVLNVFGGVVSGLWLLIIGEWPLVLLGVVTAIGSTFVLGIVLLPTLLFAGIAAIFKARPGKIATMVLSNLYTGLVILFWCGLILLNFNRDSSAKDWVPRILLTYGIAVGPWAKIVSFGQDAGGDTYGLVSVFFTQLGYATVIVMALAGTRKLFSLLDVLALFLLAAQVTNWVLFGIRSKAEEQTTVDALPEEGETSNPPK